MSFGSPLAGLEWHGVPGGLSGAVIWRGDDSAGIPRIALKGWPPGYPSERLLLIHTWMTRAAASLSFIPHLIANVSGATIVKYNSRIWDAAHWQPGERRTAATDAEIGKACESVARLHTIWHDRDYVHGSCPGIRNRLSLLGNWLASPAMPDMQIGFTPDLKSLVLEASETVRAFAPHYIRELERWEKSPVWLQPCVRDLRADHVLFSGPEVTGIVDFGAMGVNSPAVDLARLLGDYSSGNTSAFRVGLRAYREAGGNLSFPDEVVFVLGQAGTLGSIVTWLTRLTSEGRGRVDLAILAGRLMLLLHQFQQSRLN